jgi:uncharacterized HAD superfamily protein
MTRSSKPIIAVDIDGVLNDFATSFVKLSNQHFGTNLTRDDFSEDMLNVWQIDANELQKRLDFLNRDNMWDKATSISKTTALPVLKELKQHYRLIIVTSRPRSIAEYTANSINENFPDIFAEIVMPGIWDEIDSDIHNRTKADICQTVGVNYLIDDQAKHCNATAAVGIKSLLFGDEAWNRNEPIVNGVTRVDDWPAVLSYFQMEQKS